MPPCSVTHTLPSCPWLRLIWSTTVAVNRACSSNLVPTRYETYFPWIDNVYSHRSTQEYKRTALVTRYYDCRLKGRPSGTQKSDDPNKKKRKRVARARDLCDVKIKITKYPAGSAAELRAGDGIVMDTKAREEALERIGDRPFWVMQRIDGSGTGGKPAAHRHSLADSDHIKPSTAHRQLAQLRKEAERNQKLSLWKPTGPAGATAKQHARAHGIKFYSACFWYDCAGSRVGYSR